MPRPFAVSALALAVAALLSLNAVAQVVADPPPPGEVLRGPQHPILSPLEAEPAGGDSEARARNVAASKRDLAALKTFYWEMCVYEGKLRQAGKDEEAAKARETIKTYLGYLKSTRERLNGWGVDTRYGAGSLKPIPPLAPPALGVELPSGGSPEEQARARSAAIAAAQRNIQALSEYADELAGFAVAAADSLDDEDRAGLADAAGKNDERLAAERKRLEELGGAPAPPTPRKEGVGDAARKALKAAGGAP